MKRLPKILFLLVIVPIAFLLILYFVHQRLTPRTLGPSQFPLKEVAKYCVGERIREISSGPNGMVLVKTNVSLAAYQIDSGSLTWSSALSINGETFPVVVVDDHVFATDSDRLISLDLQTGHQLWSVQLDDNNAWIPDASENFVLVNTVSGPIQLYDVASGSKQWEIPGGRGYTPAFIDESIVYVIDHGVKALNAGTGQLLWEVTNQRATGIGTLTNGILFYIEYPGDETYDLVALDIKTQNELWRQNFINDIPRELSAHRGFLFMNENNALYEINTYDGTINWRKELSDPMNLSFMDEYIFVLEQFHRQIHVLDLAKGEDLSALQIAQPQIVGDRTQEMITTGKNLVFYRGCEIYIYSH